MLRWRNLLALFVVDDLLYVLSAATIESKRHAGTVSTVLLIAFLAGAVVLVAGLCAAGWREWRASRRARAG